MTRAELLEEVLQGVLLIVGEYRGSHVEQAPVVPIFNAAYVRR